ncbi:alpha/beta hydrolase [Spirillospora sp. CA-294931]|uniref:alpha/beta hydrolase n=1 Tax=Spirillospora sp. CA-294931 TaxID=3240042 RepID=UPI003D8DC24C
MKSVIGRVALAAVLALVPVAGCTAVPARTTAAKPAWADPSARPDLAPFYKQRLRWSRCGAFQCAELRVPMDYARPGDGRAFVLPVARAAAGDPARRIGSLVFNPGGPGASGVGELKDGVLDSFGKSVRTRFDIVGFDTRGVAGSRPAVNCAPGKGREPRDTAPGTLDPRTPAERAAALADARDGLAACRARSGAILPHVGTKDAARDMDVLRAALGDERLTYLGWSYGTALGTTYGELFPPRVRAMVLDGAIDPSRDWYRRAVGQGAAFGRALEDYARNCHKIAGDVCPARTPEEILDLVDDLYERTARRPLPVRDAGWGLDSSLLHDSVSLAMYTPEAQWKDLSKGLSAAAEGDGTALAATIDENARARAPRDNSEEALLAVDCLDVPHPADPRAYWNVLDRAYDEAGLFGTASVVEALGCRGWPGPKGTPHRAHAPGLARVMVIGTTGDPATPYDEAQSLAGQLPNGMLLTYKGLGHTAYGRSNACVTGAVDAYLTDLRPIRSGTTC